MELLKIKKAVRAIGASSLMVLFIGVGSSYAGIDLSGENDTTGPNSENRNLWDIADDFSFDFNNDVEAINNLEYNIETGNFEVERNTQVGDISTGDAEGDIEIINDLGMGDVEIDLADWGDVDLDFENYITGPNSENTNVVDISRSADINIDNNVDIRNNLDFSACSGSNSIRNNTVVGDIEGGDISFDIEVENSAGNGNGFVLPDFGDQSVNADFSNGITGPNSINRNRLDLDSSIDFNLNNNVDVRNNIDVNANTGNNTVRRNTVVGDISTGDANINLRVVNSTN